MEPKENVTSGVFNLPDYYDTSGPCLGPVEFAPTQPHNDFPLFQDPMQHFYVRLHGDITTEITVYNEKMLRIQKRFGQQTSRQLPILQEEAIEAKGMAYIDDPVLGRDLGQPLPIPQEETLCCGRLHIRIAQDGTLHCSHIMGSGVFQEVPGRHLIRQGDTLIHSFQLDGCRFYGFGEKTGPLEKTGQRMRFGGKDACGYDPERTDPLYKSVPFFLMLPPLNRDCVGVFYHTGADCELDIGREVNGYYPAMGQFITREPEVDVFIIFGNSMAQVVEQFTALTGRPALLPKYALGYLGSSMYYPELEQGCDAEIIAFVEKAKKMGLPCSNFQLSSGYTTDEKHRRNVFTWNRRKFPDPKGFVEKMEALGAPVTPNVKPAMLTTHPLYRVFAQEGAFIRSKDGRPYVTRFWGGEGSFVDFTNPNACRLWKHFLKQSLFAYGIHSIWNDNNEFDLMDGYCYDEGRMTPAWKLRNVLPLLMNQSGQEALLEYYPNLRPYQVSRSGCAGINRYAQVWTGDNRTGWESLKWNIATMLGSGLSGMPLTGSDVGGFAGPAPDKELFLRWIACGVVMPRFSIHSANNDNTVTEPWMYESGIPAVQSLFRLRQRLMPYLYSLHYEAHRRGLPILRPMVWEYPYDDRCQTENVDFFLGDALLCACVTEPGVTKRKVWLPQHEYYYDFYTGQCYKGGQEITLDAPLDRLPLLQKQGSMFPTLEEDGLHLWLIPGAENLTFTYYDDDGLYLEPRNQVICKFTYTGRMPWSLELTRENIQADTTWQIELWCYSKAPATVVADGSGLRRFTDYDRLRAADTGWYYDMERQTARIKPGNFRNLQVSFDTVDLIKIDGDTEAP